MRTVEILVDGKWVPACWNDLQVGVQFRLFEDGKPVDNTEGFIVTQAAKPYDAGIEDGKALIVPGPGGGVWLVSCEAALADDPGPVY